MFDELDPGLPMMLVFLVGFYVTILAVDLSSKNLFATTAVSVLGFYIVLIVISFRYHCVAKEAIVSD